MTSPMEKDGRRLVIVGDSYIAEIAYEYFTFDSPYEIAAFTVEQAFLKRDRLFDVPVVAFEEIDTLFPPERHEVFVALGYVQMNRVRARLLAASKAKGYGVASYVNRR